MSGCFGYTTKFGFVFGHTKQGAMKVKRVMSGDKLGAVISVETSKEIIEIRATPKSGKMSISRTKKS